MGAIYPDRKCWCRGKSVADGSTVYGNYVQMLIDSEVRPHIYPFPKNPNSGNHAYTPQPVECIKGTIQRETGLTDSNGERIYEGDTVEIPSGQTGEVVYELGTWGVAVPDLIDYETLENIVDETRYGNAPHFLYNDNFISFYELIDNFCSEDAVDACCSAVHIIEENIDRRE